MFPTDYPDLPRAACAETDPEVFAAATQVDLKRAKLVCNHCPERLACLEWALIHDEPFGVWGGKDYSERKRLSVRIAS